MTDPNLMFDGIASLAPGIARQFPDVKRIAGYVNGRYAWSQAEWDLFPHADKVRIATRADVNDGDVLDVERYDASPDQTAGWIAMRHAAGLYRPTIYCSRSVIPAVRAGTGSYILGRDYDIWVADYTGQPHQVAAPGQPPAMCAATQYESTAGWDATMVYDTAWPHRRPPAPPKPALGSATVRVTLVRVTGTDPVYWWDGAALWHVPDPAVLGFLRGAGIGAGITEVSAAQLAELGPVMA